MEESKNSVALILQRQAYRENDSLVTVYSRDYGKLKLVARGTQKLRSKLAGHIEPLGLVDLMIIHGQGYDYIGSAIRRYSYRGIREDLNKLYYAGQALSLFDRLVREDQPDKALFNLLSEWLQTLNDFSSAVSLAAKPATKRPLPASPAADFSRGQGDRLLAFFIWKFLGELGYQPETHICHSCGRALQPGKNYFDLAAGGLLDAACYASAGLRPNFAALNYLPISDDSVKVLRFINDNGLPAISKLKLAPALVKELFRFSQEFLKFCV